jgi:DNA-binding transcriptional LysR family regulator
MTKCEMSRLGEMEMFARVVDTGDLSTAARSHQMSTSAVSKIISRLEARLEVRLFNRSTRALQLTQEGQIFYDHCTQIVAHVNEAESHIQKN